MSCFHPLTAYWRNVSRDGITFDPSRSATKVPFQLPCGRCIGCRLEKARQWGIRCLHEAKMWPHNHYVTLTYSPEFLPDGGTLVLRDLQLFMKRLRKAKGSNKDNPLRFFAGGEYGEGGQRPHYHLLLFNCPLTDLRQHGTNMRGEPLFVSREMSEIWFQGFHTIGAVTFDSAVYCAKYALKKVNGDPAYEHYQVMDADGIVYDRRPEFAVMSRRPGIGATYYQKFGKEVRDHDSVVVNGMEVRPPRYYDQKTEELDPSVLDKHKKDRKRLSVLNRHDNVPERLAVKERLAVIGAEKKKGKI